MRSRYLEHHGIAARRRSGPERIVIPTTGMIAGHFTHAVNRNGDPHLHSHVVMANLVHGVDGRWSACDGRGIAAHRQAAAAVYAAHLRAGLSAALGVRWVGVPGRPAEIAGVVPELLGEFSSRAADIRRHMHEVGARSVRGNRVAWAATRPAKEPQGLATASCAAEWARRASVAGRPAGAGARATAGGSPGPLLFDEHRFAGSISLTAHGGAHRRDVVAALRGRGTRRHRRHLPRAHRRRTGCPIDAVGVAEPLHQRRAVVPATHHLRALGPRPVDPGDHEVWVDAAAAIDAYRVRWGLARSPEPLGTEPSPSGLASLPTRAPRRPPPHHPAARGARSRLGRREAATIEHGLGR